MKNLCCKSKGLVSLLLIVTLVCGIIPTNIPLNSALAESIIKQQTIWDQTLNLPIGTNPAEWGVELTPNNTLCVYAYYGNETDIIVPSRLLGYEVTDIYCDNLCSNSGSRIFTLTLPETVRNIKGFMHTNISKLTVCGDIESIPAIFCCNHDHLKEVTFLGDIGVIGREAFAWCDALTNFTVNGVIMEIDEHAFYNSNKLSHPAPTAVLQSNKPSDNSNKKIVKSDDFLYEINEEDLSVTLLEIPSTLTNQTHIELPAYCNDLAVTTIGDFVFSDCIMLEEISIPEGVVSIGQGAFMNCESLQKVKLPQTLTTIQQSAFSNCTSLGQITIPTGVRQLGDYAFSNCTSLKEVNFSFGLEHIGKDAFRQSAVREVVLPDSVVDIGERAFSQCESLKSFVFSKHMDTIPESCLHSCSSLSSVTLPPVLTQIESEAFRYCYALTSITLPKSVFAIGSYAFDGCNKISKLTLPDNLRSLGRGAFMDTNLSSLKIPESITVLPERLFEDCDNLSHVDISDNTLYIGRKCFEWCLKLRKLDIPQGLQVLANEALSYCGIQELTLPASMTHIGSLALNEMGATSRTMKWIMLKQLTIHSYHCYIAEDFLSNHSELYRIDGSDVLGSRMTLVCQPGCTMDQLLINSKLVTKEYLDKPLFLTETAPAEALLSASLYAGRDDLSEIIIPEGVVAIEAGAFADCDNLTTVTFPSTLQSIGDEAFVGCDTLRSISLPISVTELGHGVFALCPQLSEVELSSNLTILPDLAFAGCSSLKTIAIPSSVVSLGDGAFLLCDLQDVMLPATLQTIGEDCFAYNANLAKCKFRDNLTTIGSQAFMGCSSLYQIFIPNKVTIIPERAFAECTNLSKVSLPQGMISIHAGAFMHCAGGNEPMRINLPPSLVEIAADIFFCYEENVQAYVTAGTLGESFVQEKQIPFLYVKAE
ncbi:MAG: leucine-rich repeat domain-containing protein [Clostridia bacterium]|nr:leucine-rich repeat domain-containing protein [Clostridia bacterium]